MLIGRCIIQGCGASMLVSLAMVVVSDITIERKRGKFTSMFSAIWADCLLSGVAAGCGCFTFHCVDFIGMVVPVTGIVIALLALCFGSKDYTCSAISAGLHLLPYILPISIFLIISGFVVAKTGCYRELLWVGGSITTIGTGLFVLLDESTSMGRSIRLTIIGGAGMGLLLQPMLLALQTAIQPRNMATGTTLFVAIYRAAELYLSSLRSNAGIMHIDQAVVHASSTLPKLSQALIDAYVITLRPVFYASIPFAVMIVVVLAVFVHHILLFTHMAKTVEE
ncbi:hypothetical protein H4S07_000439 [Coemansia furcata]|uniref:Uncharacterized protein n=1 Tax=Coemansia furcata TaxID=417177 RepID=A0ACC1LSA3_9FUNG|nr:hypothetical protein H4S07_000439 [Coemansia furcata]